MKLKRSKYQKQFNEIVTDYYKTITIKTVIIIIMDNDNDKRY